MECRPQHGLHMLERLDMHDPNLHSVLPHPAGGVDAATSDVFSIADEHLSVTCMLGKPVGKRCAARKLAHLS